MTQFFHVAWVVLRKDLTVEARSREVVYTTAFFAMSCILVFAFALVKEGRPLEDAAAGILWMMALLAAGTVGFASVGTLFAAMLVRARSRDVLLPVLLYPITVPVIIAGVRGTMALLQPTPDLEMVRFWVALLVFFDVVFVTLALWTFEPLMTE